MKEVLYSVSGAMDDVRAMTGLKVKVRVNRGRNKIEMIEGVIENAYPNIFTIRKENGELNSFSSAAPLPPNAKFLR